MSSLLPDELKDERVFIIGGGPSLLKYLPPEKQHLLNDKRVIVVNNGYKLYPEAFLLHFADHVWWTWNAASVKQIWRGKYMTSIADNFRKRSSPSDPNVIHLIKDANNTGLSSNLGHVSGSNGGHHAINIAVNLGAKEIVLIGFDMDAKATETHWHSEHKRQMNRNQYTEVMLPGLTKAADLIKERGVDVYNVNPESAIKCFPFRELESFLD